MKQILLCGTLAASLLCMGSSALPAQEKEAPASAPAAPMIPQDQQASDEQMQKLFDAMHIKEQLATMKNILPQVAQQQMQRQMEQMQKDHPELHSLDPQTKQKLNDVMDGFLKKILGASMDEDIFVDLRIVYQRHMSREDVEALTVFYNSPAGKHLLAMTPVIMQEYMPMMMDHMQAKMKPILQEMENQVKAITASAKTSAVGAKHLNSTAAKSTATRSATK